MHVRRCQARVIAVGRLRKVTVSFDPASWTGFAVTGGTLSWPVWNDASAVSQTALDLTASGTCVSQVPAGQ